jgi:hypothetical protein
MITKLEAVEILNEAHKAGCEAAKKKSGEQYRSPGMSLDLEYIQYESPFLKNKIIDRWEYLDTFPCGFAWIEVRTYKDLRNKDFISVLRTLGFVGPQMFSQDHERKTMYMYWVGDFNQSMALKSAYADAFVKKLKEYHIEAWAKSRID